MNTGQRTTPSCLGCIHYYITHDAAFPYGCRAMDFKSRRMPILEVIAAYGACFTYQPKPPPTRER